MPDPIPGSVPLALAPNDFQFEACIKNAPLTQARTFTLTMTGGGRMILRRFRLAGPGAGRFTLFGPGEVTLTSGQSATFSVIFDPVKVRTYKARVVFSIIHHRGDGTNLLVWGRVPLEGIGKDCAAEVAGDPPPPEQEDDNEGEGDGPDDGDDGAGPGEAPSPGGGGAPGTEPPGGFNGQSAEICLRFWKLPGAADDLGAAEFDEWVREINRIYSGSGVQFRRGAGDVERIDTPLQKSDDHCFDIYVGGTDLIPGDTAAQCQCSPSGTTKGIQEEEGAHEEFCRHGGWIGTSIQMESGHGPNVTPPTTTLAHELGHALGLGPAVEAPDGSQDHLDPDDGQPITDEDRLMHPSPGGTRMTDKERRIAARMALLLKGGPNTSKCHKTTEYRYEPVRERGAFFEAVEYRSLGESVQLTARTSTGFPVDAPHRLSVDISTDDAIGRWSSTINYSAEGEDWRHEAEHGRTEVPPGLPAPSFVESVDGPVEAGSPRQAYGVRIDVPNGYFGLSHRTVALRLTAAMADGPARSYPSEGYVKLDLTPPVFTIALSEESRNARAERGGTLQLGGSGWQSATFTGQVGLTLWLRRHGVSRLVELKPLPKPIPEQWNIEADLPQDLPAGEYRLYLLGSCRQCGVDSSASGQLSLSSGRQATHSV